MFWPTILLKAETLSLDYTLFVLIISKDISTSIRKKLQDMCKQ